MVYPIKRTLPYHWNLFFLFISTMRLVFLYLMLHHHGHSEINDAFSIITNYYKLNTINLCQHFDIQHTRTPWYFSSKVWNLIVKRIAIVIWKSFITEFVSIFLFISQYFCFRRNGMTSDFSSLYYWVWIWICMPYFKI